MNNPAVIPTNFLVPKNCQHEWILFYQNEFVSAMHGVPGRKEISHFSRDPGNLTAAEQSLLMSRSLDWIAESVEHLRFICQ